MYLDRAGEVQRSFQNFASHCTEQMSHFGTEDFLAIMETFKNIKTQLTAGKRIKIKDHATQQGWTVA